MSATRTIAAFVVLASLLAGGCAVHKVVVQQGNVITQNMVDKLEPGMTKSQVAFVMGRPVLRNTFRPNRWDYVYTIDTGRGKPRQQRVTLHFENDELTRIEGDLKPTGGEITSSSAQQTSAASADEDTRPAGDDAG